MKSNYYIMGDKMRSLLILLSFLNSYKIVWEDTHFKIPLNENTHVYYEIPKAVAYDHLGNKINTEVYYQRGVNHTTLKVVNSLHVKTFKIDYKAFFPEIGRESIQTIQFEIIDIIEPEFLYIPEISMPVKTKRKTEKEIVSDLIYQDNYYDNEDLIVRVNGLESVNINLPGKYQLTYEIIDPSFNIKEEIRYYEVYNNIPPEIKVKLPVKLEFGTKFFYEDYFTLYDEYNSLVEKEVDLRKVDYSKIGNYEIFIKITNQAGLTASGTYNLEIVDTKKPVLIVKDKQEFNYLDDINLSDLIVDVYDNYDELTKDDVIITGYYDVSKLGSYTITYEVFDSSLNSQVVKITFQIVDLEKPEIKLLVDEIIINVFNEELNYYNYFLITDNYNSFDDLKITFIKGGIDYKNLGTYYLTVEVSDVSKNKKIKQVPVYIKDLESPLVTTNYDDYIYIDQYGYLSDTYFLKYFLISDNFYERKAISIEIDSEINFYESNEITRTFIFKDPSDNETVIEDVKILILETRPPILELNTNTYKYYIGDEIPNLELFVKGFYDYTNNIEDLVLVIEENINYSEIGLYIVTYKGFNNKINNQTTKELLFYVDFKSGIKSTITNLEVYQDDFIDELSGVTLSEDIVKYDVFPKVIDTSSPGIKERVYILYDKRGNIEKLSQEIVVKPQEKQINYQKVIIINAFIITSFTLFHVFRRRRKDLF